MDIIQEAKSKAEQVFMEYNAIIPDWNSYRCDSLLMNIVHNENIITESHSFSDDLCGMLYVDEDEKTIVYNVNHSPERRNFTIGHELGHYYLHLNLQSQFADRSTNMLDSSNNKFEMQANAFSAHLTLPDLIILKMVSSNLDYIQIKKRVKISDKALYWRLVNYLIDNCNLYRKHALKIVTEFRDYSIAMLRSSYQLKRPSIYPVILNNNNIHRLTRLYNQYTSLELGYK